VVASIDHTHHGLYTTGQDGRRVERIDEPHSVPVLNIYSDSAWPHLSEWPQYARNHEQLAGPAATVVNVHIAGVGHLGLTDLALSSPLLTRLLDGHAPSADPRDALEELRRVCLDFLDAHLGSAAPTS
jgi:hypothetical protein